MITPFPERKRRFNVLCLSGGGFRGLYTARLAALIEARFKCHLRDKFDLIVGTSAGGLIAAALAYGRPAAEIAKAFEDFGERIFPRQSASRRFMKTIGLRPQYTQAGLREAIVGVLGTEAKRSIEQHPAPLAIVSLSYTAARHLVFHSRGVIPDQTTHTSILDAVLASAAAPTYFPEHRFNGEIAVDGGLVANSPELVGILTALKHMDASLDTVYCLSIGTASPEPGNAYSFPWSGRLGDSWLKKLSGYPRSIVDLTLSAQERLAVDISASLLGSRYMRLDQKPPPSWAETLKNLDDAGSDARGYLDKLARETWDLFKDRPQLEAFVHENAEWVQ